MGGVVSLPRGYRHAFLSCRNVGLVLPSSLRSRRPRREPGCRSNAGLKPPCTSARSCTCTCTCTPACARGAADACAWVLVLVGRGVCWCAAAAVIRSESMPQAEVAVALATGGLVRCARQKPCLAPFCFASRALAFPLFLVAAATTRSVGHNAAICRGGVLVEKQCAARVAVRRHTLLDCSSPRRVGGIELYFRAQ